MIDAIRQALDAIVREEPVRILYACESGSRAWGFESTDSDYDVRFLYLRPTDWYLTIQTKRDVIERPIDERLDLCGWDLTKALGLLRKSNPPLLEWLQSPIVYREEGSAAARMRALMPDYYSPVACLYHYLHMARRNHNEFLDRERVRLKKYLYVLRPVLACLWIERGLGVVPTEFGRLVEQMVEEPELLQAIDELVERKRQGDELGRGPRISVISAYLEAQLARLTGEHGRPATTTDPEPLDRLFREVLVETFGTRLA